MANPSRLTLRQMIEGMTLSFDPHEANDLEATIQFYVIGAELATYHLCIAGRNCTFHLGVADSPSLTITTPAEVWLAISSGELDGQEALLHGQYQASGDLGLLLRMGTLFQETSYSAPQDQRPAGPIPLPGMAWMVMALIPWIVHWATFDLASPWISVGLPLLLFLLVVAYRLAFNRPAWMEIGGLAFFVLAGILTLVGDPGYTRWGSVVSAVALGTIWLGTLLLSEMPPSGDYSKWGYDKRLWRLSMFLHPNAVISLVWGWQFLLAAILGAAAILLPEFVGVFTPLRYLLQVPAFVFTFLYPRGAANRPIVDVERALGQIRFWAGMGLSAASGMLLIAAMPGFNVNLLGWLALVPLLLALYLSPLRQHSVLALPFGLVWSVAAHNYYPSIFSPALGVFLIFAVGVFYAGLIQLGVLLQSRLPGALGLLGLPVTWAALEFAKFVAPVVREWWFALLPKSVWRFPPALQILSLTGFPGLSFLVMLANVSLAILLLQVLAQGKEHKASSGLGLGSGQVWSGGVALILVAVVIGWGALTIPTSPAETFAVAATVDLANQDPVIQAAGEFDPATSGYLANTPKMSQAIFEVNAALTRQVAGQRPAFVVWPENEFADADDAHFVDQLKALAQETGTYIVADTVWRTPAGLHDTALMVGPDPDGEISRQAKIHLTSGEQEAGFVAGPREFPVLQTPYGKVGLGVCYDYHYLDVVRALVQSGAQLLLMPTDDDFAGNPWFPPYHASDAVFRAVEHRVAFAAGAANGVAIIVDPYGQVVAESGVNERSVIAGQVFVINAPTLYSRWGDWFGWVLLGLLAGLVAISFVKSLARPRLSI